jgi:hypothetical protein
MTLEEVHALLEQGERSATLRGERLWHWLFSTVAAEQMIPSDDYTERMEEQHG